MSTNLAFSLPAASPREREREHPRQIEIVTTRSQRRARPRLAYALVAVGGLFAIFLSQLLLSIALSNGAYQISSLLNQQRDLGRVQGALNEQLELAASTQNLAANAQKLGMVATTAPAYLRLSDGQLVGSAVAAAAAASANDKSVITNSLLAGVALLGDQAAATNEEPTTTGEDGTEMSADTATGTGSAAVGAHAAPAEVPGSAPAAGSPAAGAPAATDATPSVPSTAGALPSPVTH